MPVFRFMIGWSEELLTCASVCKAWNGKTLCCCCLFVVLMKLSTEWAQYPELWPTMTINHKTIVNPMLCAIVRRQPRALDLSWTRMAGKQMRWLLPRLPQLNELKLAGAKVAVVLGLATCNCPLLHSLDISWCSLLDDRLIQHLLSPPEDSRPGLTETKTRLRYLRELIISGKFYGNTNN